MKWQPIETAPRDGTDILLWFQTVGKVSVGMFTQRGDWFLQAIWASSVSHNEPTHWMPLPPPPELDAAAPWLDSPDCNMSAAEDGTHGNTVQGAAASPDCQNCGGVGTVTEYEDGLPNGEFECPECKGTGVSSSDDDFDSGDGHTNSFCQKCDGTGKESK